MLFPMPEAQEFQEKILDAAAELVAEIGAGRLTLEAVAERAGLSKGGLLYNFPTKEALLQGMIQRMIDQVAAEKEAAGKRRPGRTWRHESSPRPCSSCCGGKMQGIRQRHDGRHGREPAPPRSWCAR